MILKEFDGHIILNYRSGKARVVKKYDKRRILSYEIPIKYSIKVAMPEPTVAEIKGTIDLPDVKVTELVLDQIAGGDHESS